MVGGDRLVIYHVNRLQWRSGGHVKLEKTLMAVVSLLDLAWTEIRDQRPRCCWPWQWVYRTTNDVGRGVPLIYVIWVGHPRSDTICTTLISLHPPRLLSPPTLPPAIAARLVACCSCSPPILLVVRHPPLPPDATAIGHLLQLSSDADRRWVYAV
ncbi:hypothetical protein ACLOJK_022829 [Asimina triloba]